MRWRDFCVEGIKGKWRERTELFFDEFFGHKYRWHGWIGRKTQPSHLQKREEEEAWMSVSCFLIDFDFKFIEWERIKINNSWWKFAAIHRLSTTYFCFRLKNIFFKSKVNGFSEVYWIWFLSSPFFSFVAIKTKDLDRIKRHITSVPRCQRQLLRMVFVINCHFQHNQMGICPNRFLFPFNSHNTKNTVRHNQILSLSCNICLINIIHMHTSKVRIKLELIEDRRISKIFSMMTKSL